MKRLGLVALSLCACARTTEIRPADVPSLEKVEAGESVWLTAADGSTVEIKKYREARVFGKGGGGYVLPRPIRTQRWQGQLWLRAGDYAPLPYEPRHYSKAEVVHSDPANTTFIIVGAVTGTLVAATLVALATRPGLE